MGRASHLQLIASVFLLATLLGSGHALARCFGVPDEPVEPGPGWRVHLTAESGGYADGADFGVGDEASINFEPGLDAIENFTGGMPFYLYFRYPFPDTKVNYFTISIVKTADRLYWPLRLDVRVDGPLDVTIRWTQEQVANVSAEWTLTFVGPDGDRIDMRETGEITLAVGRGVHALRVDALRSDDQLTSPELTVLVVLVYGAAVAIILVMRRRRRRV